MSSDSFRLDPLIKIRENLRDERRRELAKAETEAQFERLRLTEAEKELDKNLADWSAAAEKTSPSIEALSQLQRHRDRLRRLHSEIAARLTRLDGEAERVRKLFDEAVRDVRVLENLKERKRDERSADERKTEQKELDEIASRKS